MKRVLPHLHEWQTFWLTGVIICFLFTNLSAPEVMHHIFSSISILNLVVELRSNRNALPCMLAVVVWANHFLFGLKMIIFSWCKQCKGKHPAASLARLLAVWLQWAALFACQCTPGCLETWAAMRALAPNTARGGWTDGRADDNSSFQCPTFPKITAQYRHEHVTSCVCLCASLWSCSWSVGKPLNCPVFACRFYLDSIDLLWLFYIQRSRKLTLKKNQPSLSPPQKNPNPMKRRERNNCLNFAHSWITVCSLSHLSIHSTFEPDAFFLNTDTYSTTPEWKLMGLM